MVGYYFALNTMYTNMLDQLVACWLANNRLITINGWPFVSKLHNDRQSQQKDQTTSSKSPQVL